MIKIFNKYFKSKVGFGDRVILKDLNNKEIFKVDIKRNPYNRELMKEIEVKLLGKMINNRIKYKGYKYRVIEIKKIKN